MEEKYGPSVLIAAFREYHKLRLIRQAMNEIMDRHVPEYVKEWERQQQRNEREAKLGWLLAFLEVRETRMKEGRPVIEIKAKDVCFCPILNEGGGGLPCGGEFHGDGEGCKKCGHYKSCHATYKKALGKQEAGA